MRPGVVERLLRTLLSVRPGEGERVALMFAWNFLVIGGVIIVGQLVGSALFLSALPRSAVAVKFLAPAIALVLVSSLYARLAALVPRRTLLLGTLLAATGGFVGFRLLLATALGASLPVLAGLYVFVAVVGFLLLYQFWNVAQDLFDSREAKRHFSLIAGGGTLAAMVFGGGLSAVARRVDPGDLLYVIVFSLGVLAVLVGSVFRRHPERLAEPPPPPPRARASEPEEPRSIVGQLRSLRESPLLVTMSLLIVILSLVSDVAEYQFDLAIQERFGSRSDDMVAFLGAFRLWTGGVLALVVQVVLARRLLSRFGVVGGLLTMPMTIGAGALGAVVTGGLWAALIVPRATEFVLKFNLYDSTFNLLYLPVRGRLRARAKILLDGVVKPSMAVVLGLVFLAVGRLQGVQAWHWSLLLLPLATSWALLLRRARRQYVDALADSVRMRRFVSGGVGLEDETTRRVLAGFFRHPDPRYVIHALGLAEEARALDLTEFAGELLARPEPEVRALSLQVLGEREGVLVSQLDAIRGLLGDPDDAVRAAAVRALCAAAGRRALREARPLLWDRLPEVRAAAIEGLIRHGGLDGVLQAGGALKHLLEAREPELRQQGARVLGEMRIAGFAEELVSVVRDPVLTVRREALRSARLVGSPELVPDLVAGLGDPWTGVAAAEALGASLDSAHLARVEEVVRDPTESVVRRQRAVLALGYGPPEATTTLWGLAGLPHPGVRSSVVGQLVGRRGVQKPPWTVPDVQQRLRAELSELLRLVLLRAQVRGSDPCRLLTLSLGERIQAARDRLLGLSVLASPELVLHDLRGRLDGDDPRARATAAELLDNVLPTAGRRELLMALAEPGPERVAAARQAWPDGPEGLEETLEWLLWDEDGWLRACALLAVRLGEGEHRRAVQSALADPDPVVAQIAFHAGLVVLTRDDLVGALQSLSACPLTPEAAAWLADPEAPMPLSRLEKVLFLKSIGLFESISADVVASVAPLALEERFEPGEVFIRRGDRGDSLFIVVDGEVEVRVPDQVEPIVMGAGSVIGELGVLADRPRGADCAARGEVVALRLDRSEFWELLRANSEMAIGVIEMLMRRYVRPA